MCLFFSACSSRKSTKCNTTEDTCCQKVLQRYREDALSDARSGNFSTGSHGFYDLWLWSLRASCDLTPTPKIASGWRFFLRPVKRKTLRLISAAEWLRRALRPLWSLRFCDAIFVPLSFASCNFLRIALGNHKNQGPVDRWVSNGGFSVLICPLCPFPFFSGFSPFVVFLFLQDLQGTLPKGSGTHSGPFPKEMGSKPLN